MRDLDRSHVSYASYPQWAQIELILALRCTVYKIEEAILLRRMCDLERSHDLIVHICLLTPWVPKMSLFLFYDAPFTR